MVTKFDGVEGLDFLRKDVVGVTCPVALFEKVNGCGDVVRPASMAERADKSVLGARVEGVGSSKVGVLEDLSQRTASIVLLLWHDIANMSKVVVCSGDCPSSILLKGKAKAIVVVHKQEGG